MIFTYFCRTIDIFDIEDATQAVEKDLGQGGH